jgi:hypothetical protein
MGARKKSLRLAIFDWGRVDFDDCPVRATAFA